MQQTICLQLCAHEFLGGGVSILAGGDHVVDSQYGLVTTEEPKFVGYDGTHPPITEISPALVGILMSAKVVGRYGT